MILGHHGGEWVAFAAAASWVGAGSAMLLMSRARLGEIARRLRRR